MGLKAIFNTMKKEGYIIKRLDQYLLSLNKEVNDRAINVNSPSQAGACMRANFYSRLQFPQDSNAIGARTRRIFDNGHYTHNRLQEYMLDSGILVVDEVPLRNEEYEIQGHTDGLLNLGNPRIDVQGTIDYEEIMDILNLDKDNISAKYFIVEDFNRKISNQLGILEIKSINSGGYSSLKDAKDNHKMQGMVYTFCAEERRKQLHKNRLNDTDNFEDRVRYYASLYRHLDDGSKFTKEEKLLFKVVEHIKTDLILFNCPRPIDRVVFLYENKDTQDLKEYTVMYDEEIISYVLSRYLELNTHINGALKEAEEKGLKVKDIGIDKSFELTDEIEDIFLNHLPEREGTSKSCMTCRWCNYKLECWN